MSAAKCRPFFILLKGVFEMTLLTDKELNEKFPALSVSTINSLRRQGKIPHVQLPGVRRYFYNLEAVRQWLEKCSK